MAATVFTIVIRSVRIGPGADKKRVFSNIPIMLDAALKWLGGRGNASLNRFEKFPVPYPRELRLNPHKLPVSACCCATRNAKFGAIPCKIPDKQGFAERLGL